MEIMEYSEYQYIATVWLPISVNMPTTCAILAFHRDCGCLSEVYPFGSLNPGVWRIFC